MRNNDKHKKYIQKIGFDTTLQSLIEIIDDSIIGENIVPSWKLKLIEHLEHAYESYMSPENNPSYENA